MLHIKNSIDNIIQNQITFINNYILDCIKREPYYYESMEELYLWLYDIKYNEEAIKLIDWCLACKNIAFKIQKKELEFKSFSDIVDALPKL
jgi:hypothetical protein